MNGLQIRSERVALPDAIRPATISVRDGLIVAIGAHGDLAAGARQIDAGTLLVLPGLIDPHVHINDPGRAHWEGFETATRAAAAGGVTTLVDMPLNSIPATTDAKALAAKRRSATGRCHVDVGFWGGVVPGNVAHLDPLARGGVLGFKCFLSPSGVEEFEHVDERTLRSALPVLAELELPLLVHAELPSHLLDPAAIRDGEPLPDPRRYATWLRSRPPEAECAAIDLLIRLARELGARIHVVHLATERALPALDAARQRGLAISVETCPHYLTFAAEEIADGATSFKCAPPIRGRDTRERLWQALADGAIDFVATDHSPAPPDLKHLEDGDFLRAWGGIASLQLGLPVLWTGMHARGLAPDHLARWLAAAPARVCGIDGSKGAIAVGADADFAFFDPDALSTVDAKRLYHRHAVTPYDGVRLRGRVNATMLRGETIFADGEIRGAPIGKLLSR